MTTEQRYLLTEEELSTILDLSEGYALAIEKVILNAQLPRIYGRRHPAISGFEKQVSAELKRETPLPSLDDIF